MLLTLLSSEPDGRGWSASRAGRFIADYMGLWYPLDRRVCNVRIGLDTG